MIFPYFKLFQLRAVPFNMLWGGGLQGRNLCGGLGYRHVPEPKMGTGGGGYQLTPKNFNPNNRDGGWGVGIPLKQQIEL